ncbi:uncharacterized protein LOC121384482 [Gigantopelta aegis]|uniref:uncharacterized protein LOC121384482 n=1 Tax=Gigantopelta aegis TaxID=1735272 RepID=UPI001B88790A|nr:uncharacterized protein LOC121384482 [Gigantopelta aegis]
MVISIMEVSCISEDSAVTWHTSLACYLCGELFRKPRILPCGHTFCADCLTKLREEIVREAKLAGKYDPRHAEIGHFLCPTPDCHYSIRLTNLVRFTTKNRTVSEAVGAYRKLTGSKQDQGCQTDITLESILIAVPKSLLVRDGNRRGQQSFMNTVIQRAISMDSLSRNYIPNRHFNWRSCVAMLGVSVLQQLIHI